MKKKFRLIKKKKFIFIVFSDSSIFTEFNYLIDFSYLFVSEFSNEYSIELTPDLKGVLDSLIENTGIPIDELITMGLFLYHPDIFLLSNQNNIENVKLWLFLDKTEHFDRLTFPFNK